MIPKLVHNYQLNFDKAVLKIFILKSESYGFSTTKYFTIGRYIDFIVSGMLIEPGRKINIK